MAGRQSNYSEKLRDPRWQKLRLEIMQRDQWNCRLCYDSKSTLNVHHRYYLLGNDPWEYPQDALVTLCERCHKQETEKRDEAERRLLFALRAAGFYANDVRGIADAFARTPSLSRDNRIFAEIALDKIAQAIIDPISYILPPKDGNG